MFEIDNVHDYLFFFKALVVFIFLCVWSIEPILFFSLLCWRPRCWSQKLYKILLIQPFGISGGWDVGHRSFRILWYNLLADPATRLSSKNWRLVTCKFLPVYKYSSQLLFYYYFFSFIGHLIKKKRNRRFWHQS